MVRKEMLSFLNFKFIMSITKNYHVKTKNRLTLFNDFHVFFYKENLSMLVSLGNK